MKSLMPFFKTVWLSLNPWRYDEVHDRRGNDLFKYALSFIFLSFFIATIALTPWIAGFVDDQMSHFDAFSVDFKTTMNSPLMFPEHNTKLIIDTRTSEGNLTKGRVLITEDYVYTKSRGGEIESTPITDYENVLENKGFIVGLLAMLAPALFVIIYIAYLIKVILLVLAAAVLAWVITRIARFDVGFGVLMKCGLLAATWMVLLDVLTMVFGLKIYGTQYLVFLIFFIPGLIKAGETEEESPRKRNDRRRKKGGYIELRVPRD